MTKFTSLLLLLMVKYTPNASEKLE